MVRHIALSIFSAAALASAQTPGPSPDAPATPKARTQPTPVAAESARNVERVGSLGAPGSYIHLIGDALFLTPANAKVQAGAPGTWFDLKADPAAPVVVNSSLPSAWDVVVDGDHAFRCDYRNELAVYRMRREPWEQVATLPLESEAENLVLRGKLLYVANHNAGLTVVDVSAPANPVIVGKLNPKIDCDAIAFWKNSAILYAHWQCKIVIADITDPAAPVQKGECQLPAKTFNGGELEAADGFAYATTITGLDVIDVRDPAAPKPVARVDLGAVASDVVLLDRYAFVAANARGIRVLDISNPEQPSEIGHYEGPQFFGSAVAVRKVAEGRYLVYGANAKGKAAIFAFAAPR